MTEPLKPHVLDNLEGRARGDLASPGAHPSTSTRIPAHMLLALVEEVREGREAPATTSKFITSKHAVRFATADGMPSVSLRPELVKVELVEYGIAIYMHDSLDGSRPELILDIDNESDDSQPLKIYRNDALVYDEQSPTPLGGHS